MPEFSSNTSASHSWDSETSNPPLTQSRLSYGAQNQVHFEDEEVEFVEESKLIDDATYFNVKSRHSKHDFVYKSITAVLLLLIAVLLYFIAVLEKSNYNLAHHNTSNTTTPRMAVILASWSQQNVSWLSEIPEDWEVYRYNSDSIDPSSPLTVPRNQGREVMAYLTFIIDHYAALPDYIVFTHGHRRSWHQTEPMPLKLAALNLTALATDSYINFRCNPSPGCTNDSYVSAVKQPEDDKRLQAKYMPGFWNTMFPNSSDYWGMGPPPQAIAGTCCAQFAVTKEAVRGRSLEFWKMFRTPLTRDLREFGESIGPGVDGYSIGLIYELMWHMVFGKPAVDCPDEKYCEEVQWSNAIKCDRRIGNWDESWMWETTKCEPTVQLASGNTTAALLGD